jgi:hypothetical protein
MHRYTARLHRTSSSFVAQCVEIEIAGEGSTREAAIRSLKAELEDRLGHVEGIAPPVAPTPISIELLVLDDASETPDRDTGTLGPSE